MPEPWVVRVLEMDGLRGMIEGAGVWARRSDFGGCDLCVDGGVGMCVLLIAMMEGKSNFAVVSAACTGFVWFAQWSVGCG